MLKLILLGIVQGATEFFPVSSSGHLVILQKILGVDQNVVFLDAVLHLGTLFALVIFFSGDIVILFSKFITALYDTFFRGKIFYIWRYDEKVRLCVYIIIVTFITGYIGLWGKDFFESQFESVNTVLFSLIFMSFILYATKNSDSGQRYLRHITIRDAIFLGLVQAIAIIPGISRSGITISLLLFLNMDKESAFKFSFLASIPVILGAFIVKLKDTQGVTQGIPFSYLSSGFISSFVGGLVALYILNFILKRKKGFYKFSYYCFFVAMVILVMKIRHIL
ncbi:MAG: undecaprenyl-diphosphate phosphatase [Candidatus Omnitrophica bacterium]|nr:undecaprenyl-diphosphate phosphatase [Candidatus Omnitrophota bacterium]